MMLEKRSSKIVLLCFMILGSIILTSCPNADTITETATLVISNQSSFEIYYVYCTPASSDSWGSDILGVDTTIPPGSQVSVTVQAGEEVDMNAVEESEQYEWILWEKTLTPNTSSTWTIRDSDKKLVKTP